MSTYVRILILKQMKQNYFTPPLAIHKPYTYNPLTISPLGHTKIMPFSKKGSDIIPKLKGVKDIHEANRIIGKKAISYTSHSITNSFILRKCAPSEFEANLLKRFRKISVWKVGDEYIFFNHDKNIFFSSEDKKPPMEVGILIAYLSPTKKKVSTHMC